MRKMNKERKQCNKILSRRNDQGRKGQRSKMKLKRRRRRIEKERKCSIKSRRQGRFGLVCFTCSLGSALLGIGGNLLGGLGIGGFGIGGIGIGGIGIGIGQGTGLGLRLGTGFRINIFQNILGHIIRYAPYGQLVQLDIKLGGSWWKSDCPSWKSWKTWRKSDCQNPSWKSWWKSWKTWKKSHCQNPPAKTWWKSYCQNPIQKEPAEENSKNRKKSTYQKRSEQKTHSIQYQYIGKSIRQYKLIGPAKHG